MTPIHDPVSWTINGLKLTLRLELKELLFDAVVTLSCSLVCIPLIPLEGLGCTEVLPDTPNADHDPTVLGSGFIAGLNALFVDAIWLVADGDIAGCRFFSKS